MPIFSCWFYPTSVKSSNALRHWKAFSMTVVKVLLVIKSGRAMFRAHHQCFSCKACNQRIKQQLMATLQCTRLLSLKNSTKQSKKRRKIIGWLKNWKTARKHTIKYKPNINQKKDVIVALKKVLWNERMERVLLGENRNIWKKNENVPGPPFHHL